MPKFVIKLQGSGCRIEIIKQKWLIFRRITLMDAGFYTTRFITATSEEDAIKESLRVIQEELAAINVSNHSPRILVEEIQKYSDEYQYPALGKGFTWYIEK